MCEKTEKQHELDKRYLRMAAIWPRIRTVNDAKWAHY